MSTTTLSASFSVSGTGSIFRDDFVGTVSETTGLGTGVVPSYSKVIETGTTLYKANKWYRAQHTIAANQTLSLDLTGSLIDPLGQTIVFNSIRAIFIGNMSSSRLLNVGPQNVANAFYGPIKGSSSSYIEFKDYHHWVASNDYQITAGFNDIYPIKNDDYDSSSLSALVFVWILGT